MKAAVRAFLKKNLPPKFYWFIRYRLWLNRFYLRRLLFSHFVRRNPKVWGFPASAATKFVDQLRATDAFTPTEMCKVMSRYGSDKGQGMHNYTMVYSALFNKLRNRPLRIFELGLGTNNPTLASSMGTFGRPGASLRGWRQLFPDAVIFGADIDRDILFQEDRISTFYCDQLDSTVIRDLWRQAPLQAPMDILIDDGLHTFEGNVSFMKGSLEQISPGGMYVVEDINQGDIESWNNYLQEACSAEFPNFEFVFVDLMESTNCFANNLLLARRRA
jgi:hypothetical protein